MTELDENNMRHVGGGGLVIEDTGDGININVKTLGGDLVGKISMTYGMALSFVDQLGEILMSKTDIIREENSCSSCDKADCPDRRNVN